MKIKIIIALAAIVVIFIGGYVVYSSNKEVVNTNVVTPNSADPYILVEEDGYYMYCTGGIKFDVYYSSDLKSWEYKGVAYSKSQDGWESGDMWAPEVYKIDNKYYLFYSARDENTDLMQIGVAVADNPLGPFTSLTGESLTKFNYSVIDANLYQEDGINYLYFSKDCSTNIVDGKHTSQICYVEISDDFTEVLTEPVVLLTPEYDFEMVTGDYVWNEAPEMIKVDDIYYLFYSTGCYADETYSLCYATGSSPTGPFEKTGEQLIKSNLDEGFSGPGHNSVFVGNDGNYYTAYHIHTSPTAKGGNRSMVINEIEFRNGKVIVGDAVYEE